ncbi:glutamate-1-semialdehyde aminotransferase [Leptotrichia wadei]|uniref:Glutamate-1-semialdehyde 2,1-aminomutase n=1 Tax=Leptotrichia wadei TaxID=157687 RepID=A0A510KR57_9FUSO|nr:glutamate-1-semialdehyde 2,1-aminomutase [Leptotrichia wadei]BBM54230.1 glutamate-1-semialdehyde aminotransferase [Leptotrichia wadei]
MNTDNSKKIYKKAKESIPGGVNSPVRAFQSVDKEYPIFIKSGNGSKLYDEDGNEYVDMIGSWGPMILGHNYPQVLEVVKRELENGTSFGLPTKKEVELAELVKSCFLSIEKLRLTTSGTEAAMASVRLARAFTGKNKIIKFEGCYHGHSDSLLVKAGSGLLTFEHQDSNGITEGVVKDTITLPFGDFEKLKKTLENNKDIACVIIEPIPANMGLIETEKEYLEKVREITQKENIVLIFDEVISGFRVSLGGAQKIFGITPDLTILGKIIGGGYPVGGFGGKREIMDLISPVGNVYHAGTLSGNPISVAAGIETISILKENPEIYENINKKTENLANKINELIKKYDISATVNYFGSLFTIFFAKEKVKTLEDAMNTNSEFYSIYFNTMLENGVIVPPSKYEAHFVSYIHNDEDMEKILAGVEKTFEKIAKKSGTIPKRI